ncbi:bifunctional diguanylate cyclase/phosphodiesterase [Clostridium cellulovorans]|uniref:Diguanylate cyclase/phosphodiesterase with PAS/PAC sensor(S) n=1 Tax=Clostridium cellulovorans (strain ATCC 35296 / DSM 3052 / OCM 3 / 743B) TaxID=573061 RepID=D9SSQ5_CLOC7|nr:bifunctional diguanylate cyclase/phosphodiesterase [Clostridium cellulovorans]ADL52567.1 diguanylate cyclase/phosphodiesterase with PAS/PAC sensor(s) [Clostridium cellulovorans 743B]
MKKVDSIDKICKKEKGYDQENDKFVDEINEKIVCLIINNIKIGIAVLDESDNVKLVNDIYCEMYEKDIDELIGKTFEHGKKILNDDYFYAGRLGIAETGNVKVEKIVKSDGRIFNAIVNEVIIDSKEKGQHKVVLVTDLSQIKRFVSKMRSSVDEVAISKYSNVTGLPNRQYIENRIEILSYDNFSEDETFALVIVDIRRFKKVNDIYGARFGDELLKQVANRIQDYIDESAIIAHLGEDHFGVLLENIKKRQEVEMIVDRINDALTKNFSIAGEELTINCSMGISIFEEVMGNKKDLLTNAEKALIEAKDKGLEKVIYTKELSAKVNRRTILENDLMTAIEKGQFFLVYQPQVSLNTGKMVGVEALIRWSHPKLGLISPFEFIPIVEESGLIDSIGEWVIRTSCIQAKEWRDKKLPFFKVAVNISSIQLKKMNICKIIKDILKELSLDPNVLEVELTESAMMEDIELAIENFRELNNMGIKIAIDDFGTGYSSLNYLRKFSIDKLKIDRSFVTELGDDFESTIITKTIIDMAKNLSFKVIAEGVETKEHLKYLMENGCDEVQGYYFSKPITAEEVEEFVYKLN